MAGLDTRSMWDDRGFLGRGALEDGALVRPESPRRCTLPITALRVMPPNSAAIWLADKPSDQSFLSCSTRSSVHVMEFSSCRGPTRRIRPCRPGSRFAADADATPKLVSKSPSAARHIVADGQDTTRCTDSPARVP